MTNPTTPFSWQMPTSTDLVTDLPADFETFGQAVATSMADLLGGTTGQVLSKASNTNMDFTWVTSDDANAIQNSIVDAKGDLVAASANDTPARLAVGANGETLVADSSTSTGLRYTAGNAQGNPVLNSAMQIWQRGTTSTSSGGYFTADRWYQFRGAATGSWSQVTTGLPTGFQYAIKVQRTAGQTSTDGLGVNQVFETINSIPFAGKTVTLSFYAKAGANYSPTSSALAVRGYTGTGTDQAAGNFGGWTGYAEPISGSATLTTTWTRFTFTGPVASTATQFGMVFYLFGQGTAGADDSYQITGVQLDVGSVALPFRTYAGTIQGELAACQRYFQLITGGGEAFGTFYSATSASINTSFEVQMRGTPTPTYNTTYTNAIDQVGVANRTPTSYTTAYVGANGICFLANGMSGATLGYPAIYIGGNHQLSAEL